MEPAIRCVPNPNRPLRHLLPFTLALPLAACSVPLQDGNDRTLAEIQGLYTPENPEVFEPEHLEDPSAVHGSHGPQAPPGAHAPRSNLNSYRTAYDLRQDPDRWHGSIAFPIGFQATEDFGDVDELASIGLFDLAIQPAGSPVSLVVQLLGGFSSELPVEDPTGPFAEGDDTLISQFNLGLRYMMGTGNVRPYIGGGASFVDASVLGDDDDGFRYGNDELDSDSDFAGWFGGGIHFTSRSGFLLGVNVQYLFGAEANLGGTEYDLDGITAGILLGYGF